MNIDKIKVKEHMEQRGIRTRTELAGIMRITKNQLSVLLSDTYDPIKSSVNKLCNALNVLPEAIMTTENTSERAWTPAEEDAITAIELFAGAGIIAIDA